MYINSEMTSEKGAHLFFSDKGFNASEGEGFESSTPSEERGQKKQSRPFSKRNGSRQILWW